MTVAAHSVLGYTDRRIGEKRFCMGKRAGEGDPAGGESPSPSGSIRFNFLGVRL